MKLLKKLSGSSAITLGALILALALLGYSTIGGARAALTYYSEDYISTMQLHELGVSLYENGSAVATGSLNTPAGQANGTDALLQTLKLGGSVVPDNQPIRLNVRYDEELRVHNPTDTASEGEQNITQYVRVTIYRYWTQGNGEKSDGFKLDPSYIQLWLGDTRLPCGGNADAFRANDWIEDKDARTDERVVLYYTQPVAPGASTKPFADHFSIDSAAGLVVEQTTGNNNIITTTYLYDDAEFHLEVKVDAVQDHNAADAILSAWGRTASFDGTTITNIA